VETGVLSHDKEQRMIDRAKELLRLAADGTHVSGAEWVPVVEALLRDAERYQEWRKGTARMVPSCTELIIDHGLDAAIAAPEPKP